MKMDVEVKSNKTLVLGALHEAIEKALEECGQLAERYAKENVTKAGRVDTGDMRDRISHVVQNDGVVIGENVPYAVYHEVGTGIYVDPAVGKGRDTPWAYKDRKGVVHWTRGVKPIHFLRNAVRDHKRQYIEIIRKEMESV